MQFFKSKSEEEGVVEGKTQDRPLLELDLKDEELIKRIDSSISGGLILYASIKKRSENNRKYWKGEQIDASKVRDYQAKVVDNLVFRDMETMIPIITKNTPTPTFISSNKEFDRSMEKIMVDRWEVTDSMLEKNRLCVRANFLDLLGVAKYKYDPDTDEIVWEYVKTLNIVIDERANCIDDSDFLAEFISNQSVKDIIKRFPKAKDDLKRELGIKEDDDIRMGDKLTYVEFWTPDFVVWKYKGVILDKSKNPNFDYGQKSIDEMGNESTVAHNLFKSPKIPYILFQTFTLGGNVYSDTSLIEQTIALQDGVNKRKRQISDNADEANGMLVGSGDGISREEFSKIDDTPKTKIWVGQGNVGNALTRIPGNPLQGYVFNDMIESKGAIDDIWGIHAITRGATSGDDTATAKVLQQRQDYGRIDDIVKAYEDFNESYYQANFQMMLVWFKNEHVYSFLDEDDLVISSKAIIDAYSKTIKKRVNSITGEEEEVREEGDFRPPIIMVKRGSTLPTDDVSRRMEALELAKMGQVSTIDLYEKLDWPNAKEAAKRLFLEKNDPLKLYPDLAKEQEQPDQEAIDDFQRISQGLETPPNPEVQDATTAAKHIQSHNQQMDTEEFANLSDQIKQAFVAHVQSELEIAKGVLQSEQGAQEGGMQ